MNTIKQKFNKTIFRKDDGTIIPQNDLLIAFNKFENSPGEKSKEAFESFLHNFFSDKAENVEEEKDITFERYLKLRHKFIKSIAASSSLSEINHCCEKLNTITQNIYGSEKTEPIKATFSKINNNIVQQAKHLIQTNSTDLAEKPGINISKLSTEYKNIDQLCSSAESKILNSLEKIDQTLIGNKGVCEYNEGDVAEIGICMDSSLSKTGSVKKGNSTFINEGYPNESKYLNENVLKLTPENIGHELEKERQRLKSIGQFADKKKMTEKDKLPIGKKNRPNEGGLNEPVKILDAKLLQEKIESEKRAKISSKLTTPKDEEPNLDHISELTPEVLHGLIKARDMKQKTNIIDTEHANVKKDPSKHSKYPIATRETLANLASSDTKEKSALPKGITIDKKSITRTDILEMYHESKSREEEEEKKQMKQSKIGKRGKRGTHNKSYKSSSSSDDGDDFISQKKLSDLRERDRGVSKRFEDSEEELEDFKQQAEGKDLLDLLDDFENQQQGTPKPVFKKRVHRDGIEKEVESEDSLFSFANSIPKESLKQIAKDLLTEIKKQFNDEIKGCTGEFTILIPHELLKDKKDIATMFKDVKALKEHVFKGNLYDTQDSHGKTFNDRKYPIKKKGESRFSLIKDDEAIPFTDENLIFSINDRTSKFHFGVLKQSLWG